MSDPEYGDADPGQCRSCRHHRLVASGRGSRFHLCRLSATDSRFPRYPRIPVIDCCAFEPVAD